MSVGVMEDYKLRDLRASHKQLIHCTWNKKKFIKNLFFRLTLLKEPPERRLTSVGTVLGANTVGNRA